MGLPPVYWLTGLYCWLEAHTQLGRHGFGIQLLKQVTEMYDVALNTWTTKSTNAVMAKNTLWNLADGRVGSVDKGNTTYAYDIALNTWSFLYGFNNPATQPAACTVLSDGSIFITSVSSAYRVYPEETGATPGRAALLGYLAAT